jgi:hypothetical protein
VGLFVMGRGGLEAAPSPELLFTNAEDAAEGGAMAAAGAAIGAVLEGARPLLVEIQALCSPRQQVAGPGGGGDDDDEEDEEEREDGGGGGGYGGGGYGGFGGRRQREPPALPLMRVVTGFRDRSRVSMLMEVLAKHTTIKVTRGERAGHRGIYSCPAANGAGSRL